MHASNCFGGFLNDTGQGFRFGFGNFYIQFVVGLLSDSILKCVKCFFLFEKTKL